MATLEGHQDCRRRDASFFPEESAGELHLGGESLEITGKSHEFTGKTIEITRKSLENHGNHWKKPWESLKLPVFLSVSLPDFGGKLKSEDPNNCSHTVNRAVEAGTLHDWPESWLVPRRLGAD